MRHMFAAIFAVLFLAAASVPVPVEAKTYPRVAGLSCSSAVKQVGAANVWRTFFRGARERLTEMFGRYDWYQAAPCFTSQANCKAWLYNTQTDFPLMMDFIPCHRGLR